MAIQIASHRGNRIFSILLTKGLSMKKQKIEITRGKVTEAAYFSTMPIAIALMMMINVLTDLSYSPIIYYNAPWKTRQYLITIQV